MIYLQGIELIVSVLILIAVIIVGYIFKSQINSQKLKVELMEKTVSAVTEFNKFFDMELVKKYMENERLLMKQDIEIIRRQIISKTTEDVKVKFTELAKRRLEQGTGEIMNDLTKFAYWFFLNHIPRHEWDEYLESFFPNIHTTLREYFDHYENQNKQQEKENVKDDDSRQHS